MKTALFLIFFLTNASLFSQIIVKENKETELYKTTMGLLRLVKFEQDSSSFYAFYFRDGQYQYNIDYKYIHFDNSKDLIDFFQIVQQVIEEKKKLSLSIGDQSIILDTYMGAAMIYFKGGYQSITKKQAQSFIESIH